MTPICDMQVNYTDSRNFDILQPIAESHISVHRREETIVADIFSCKSFDDSKIMKLLDSETNNVIQIQRGLNYK